MEKQREKVKYLEIVIVAIKQQGYKVKYLGTIIKTMEAICSSPAKLVRPFSEIHCELFAKYLNMW